MIINVMSNRIVPTTGERARQDNVSCIILTKFNEFIILVHYINKIYQVYHPSKTIERSGQRQTLANGDLNILVLYFSFMVCLQWCLLI